MNKKIKIVLLESSPEDISLIVATLEKAAVDFDKIIVHTKDAFLETLAGFCPDIILFGKASFTAVDALGGLKQSGLKIPFIIIVSPEGEEHIAAAMENGADDYILKDHTEMLPMAMRSTLEKMRLQKEREEIMYTQSHLAAIVGASNDGIISKKLDGTIITWNPSAERIFGYPSSEAIGKNITMLIPPERLHEEIISIETIKRGEHVQHFETVRIRKDGKAIDVMLTISPLKDGNGNITGAAKVVHDITEKKKIEEILRESEHNLQTIFQNTTEGFILTDKKGFVKTFNNKARGRIRLNTGHTIATGENICNFLEIPGDENCKESIAKVLTGEVIQYDHAYTRANNETKWFSFTINPVYHNGFITGMSITSADITQRKQNEKLLERSESNLNALIENTDAMIYSLDREFKFVTFNKKLKGMISRSYGIVIQAGHNMLDVISQSDPLLLYYWKDIYSRALTGEIIKFEKETNFNGLTSSFSIYPIWEHNKVIGLSCFVYDISERKKTEAGNRFKADLLNTIGQAVIATDINGNVNYWNKAAETMYGWTMQEALGNNTTALIYPGSKERGIESMKKLREGESWSGEFILQRKNGSSFPAFVTNSPVYDAENIPAGIISISSDVTEKKKLEDLLDKTNQLARIGSWEVDMINNTIYLSPITKEIHEVDKDFIQDMKNPFDFYKEGRHREAVSLAVQEAITSGTPYDLQVQIITAKGNERWVRTIGNAEFVEDKCVRLNGSFQDIDAGKKAQLEIIKAYEEKNTILESIGDGFYALDYNFIVTYWNKEAEKLMSVQRNEIIGKYLWDLFPESAKSQTFKNFQEVIRTGQAKSFESFNSRYEKWFELNAYPSPTGLSIFFKDVTERKQSQTLLHEMNEDLQKSAKELAISNAELEQFAYVASHDLQEPLRMVTSFLTLLEKRYSDVIDDKGREYINFAVDGSRRMRQIILDLLEFSRVGKGENSIEDVDLNVLVHEILSLHRRQIDEKKAIVNVETLPVIKSFRTPLRQVFQNLISNSLKYHRDNVPPEISISVSTVEKFWQFTITDNGIGINGAYLEKIFIIFQRLHNRKKYEGTGIGLAITKKIIEGIGGTIHVNSEEGKRSSFIFTIPQIHT